MTELDILSRFVSEGMTPTAAEAMWGNIYSESGGESNRVQGDFSPTRIVSKSYTKDVDEGRISPSTFARDGRGYGLVQWTFWSRKQGLLNYAKAHGKSIGDTAMQVDYIVVEFKSDFPALWQYLTVTDNLYEATRRICMEFERPAVNNVDARYTAAQAAQKVWDAAQVEPPKVSGFWPPRMICKGMDGPDVAALQALLTAHGYTVRTISGVFDEATEVAVKKYQTEHGLDVDGIVGPKTWASLLAMA